MFNGHKFIKLINNEWVLDINTYTGYIVKLKKDGTVDKYTEAFKASEINEDNIYFDKFLPVPIKVLNEASLQIIKHSKQSKQNQVAQL